MFARSRHDFGPEPGDWLWSALLHGGLLGFLALATLPCASFEQVFAGIGLPKWLNPVQCSAPVVAAAGPVIEATLVIGPAAVKAKAAPPPPPPAKPKVERDKPEAPVPILPPPAEQPALENQQEVVALAAEKAEQAKREQEKREKQHQAELAEERQRAEKLFQQLAKVREARADAEAERIREQQRLEQLADRKARQQPEAPLAEQTRSGQGGSNSALASQYGAILTQLINGNWYRPPNIPDGAICMLHIVQAPGGMVLSVKVDASCPFDEPGRRSIENAVLRSQPLPYKGFEQVFQRNLHLRFKVQK